MTAAPKAGLPQALASEWTKARTVRSTMWTLGMVVLATVAVAVLVGATGSLQPDDTVLGGSLTGAALGQIAAAAFGVLVVCGEYGSGTIRPTLTACPRRFTVLVAKTVLVAALAAGTGLVAGAAAYLAGRGMLAGQGHAAGEPVPALFGVALNLAAVAVLGVTAGAVLRHAAGAVSAMVLLLLVPTLVGPLLGGLRPWVSGASPLGVLQKLSQTSDATAAAVGSLGAWPSLLVLGAYTAAAWLAGAWLFHRRDA